MLTGFGEALVVGGHLIIATHVGDDDIASTEAYGGVAVSRTTYQWQPEQLVVLLERAGLRPVVELTARRDS